MKLKASFLLPGLIALTLAASTVIASFSPALAASTQTTEHGGHGKRGEGFKNLNLTDAQKAQAKQIRESTRQQMSAVFTADQKAQFKAARANHTKPNVTLSADQKAQLKQIRASAKSQFEAILTPTQLQQLQADRAQWLQNHPNAHSGQSN